MTQDGEVEPLDVIKAKFCEGPSDMPGVRIPVGGQLVYEGAGNAFIPAGTVGFWWRPDAKIQTTEAAVLSISSFQRFYFSRWLYLSTRAGRLGVTLYHGDGADALEDSGAIPGAVRPRKNNRFEIFSAGHLKPGGWIYVTVTWDMGRGLAFYLDGRLVRRFPNPWYFGGNVNHISLGSHTTGYSKPGVATFPQSFADVQIYDCWMDEGNVARLAGGKAPEEPEDFSPMLEERARRLGLRGEFSSPEAGKESLWIRQIGVLRARDVRRRTLSGLDGDLGRAWPLYQGYSDSGRMLDIELPGETRFEAIQVFGSGPMEILADQSFVMSLSSATGEVYGAFKAGGWTAREVQVKREGGLLFNLGIFQVKSGNFPKADSGWQFSSLGKADEAFPFILRDFAPYDRTVLQAQGKPGAGYVELPALRAAHLLGPTPEGMRGLRAIALDLSVKNPPERANICLMVMDPLTNERRACMVNFHATGERMRVVLDVRDLIYPGNRRPWLVLYPGESLKVNLSESVLGLQWTDVEDAKAECVADQLALTGDAFQELSESRPWARDPEKVKWLGSLLARLDLLKELEPDDPVIAGYWCWTHPGGPTPPVKLPGVPAGVPPWAFYTERAVKLFRKAAYWWIDNRQSDAGEFGAPDGINDDTDLIQDWLAIDFMNGPDIKIRRAIDKVADVSWRLRTVEGISNQVTDTLHFYEWGINAQALAFVLNYGDPVYFERLLRFSSHYPDLMTEACEGGHLHFKSWYLGADRLVTEGIYGRDITTNALLLQPAMLLAWYNGDAKATDIVARWTKGMLEHIDARASMTDRTPSLAVEIPSGKIVPQTVFGISFADAPWAAYDLTRDTSFRDFAGRMIGYEIDRKPTQAPLRSHSILGAYLKETGDPTWDAFWQERASDVRLWERSLHNGNYRELDYFYAAWLRTGDDKWLNEGTKLALYHLTWSLPMLTEAEATTDRVWLPQRLANQMTLGGLAILRNEIYPKLAVSWENATGRFAPLVRGHSRESLEMEIHNLEDKPVRAAARVWALDAGIYEVRVKTGAQEAVKEMELFRHALLPLELPPKSGTTVTAKLKKKTEDIRKRADLAISRLDASYDEKAGQLACTIHNIGAKPSGPFRAVAWRNGKEIARREFAPLGQPENFRTNKAVFPIPVEDPASMITVRVLSEEGVPEITLSNNALKIAPADVVLNMP